MKTGNVLVNLGAHPALSFKTMTIPSNGGSLDVIRASRYLAGELSPNYFLSKNISIGMYYLYSRCLENDAARNTNFLTLNGNISNIKLSNQVFMKFTPQVYYLRMDKQDGLYFTSALTLVNKKYPLSISGVINKIIRTDITASKNFVWNVSLIYSFNKKYVRQ